MIDCAKVQHTVQVAELADGLRQAVKRRPVAVIQHQCTTGGDGRGFDIRHEEYEVVVILSAGGFFKRDDISIRDNAGRSDKRINTHLMANRIREKVERIFAVNITVGEGRPSAVEPKCRAAGVKAKRWCAIIGRVKCLRCVFVDREKRCFAGRIRHSIPPEDRRLGKCRRIWAKRSQRINIDGAATDGAETLDAHFLPKQRETAVGAMDGGCRGVIIADLRGDAPRIENPL